MLKLCNAVYWLALVIWISMLIAAGVAAMSAFTSLPDPDLGLRLDAFDHYDASHHGRIAAGHVMEPIFVFVDVVSAPAIAMLLLALVLHMTYFRMPWRSVANLVRTVVIAMAAGMFLWRVITITPEMNRDLRAYWEAARQGDVAAADRHLAAFNTNHRLARPIMDATLILLLVGVSASAIALTRAPDRGPNRNLKVPELTRRS
jgi:hypothetical protein